MTKLNFIDPIMTRQASLIIYKSTDVSKIDENRFKQTLASLPCFGAYR